MNKASLNQVVGRFYGEYMKTTPKRLKIIDAYLFYILLTGIVQFLYCCLVGSFPFNSFLSGFISTVSCFVLGGTIRPPFVLTPELNLTLFSVCLRLQVNPENKSQFFGISPERGFADFIFAHIILHLTVINFIG